MTPGLYIAGPPYAGKSTLYKFLTEEGYPTWESDIEKMKLPEFRKELWGWADSKDPKILADGEALSKIHYANMTRAYDNGNIVFGHGRHEGWDTLLLWPGAWATADRLILDVKEGKSHIRPRVAGLLTNVLDWAVEIRSKQGLQTSEVLQKIIERYGATEKALNMVSERQREEAGRTETR